MKNVIVAARYFSRKLIRGNYLAPRNLAEKLAVITPYSAEDIQRAIDILKNSVKYKDIPEPAHLQDLVLEVVLTAQYEKTPPAAIAVHYNIYSKHYSVPPADLDKLRKHLQDLEIKIQKYNS